MLNLTMDTNEIIRLLKLKDEKALSYLYKCYSEALNGILVRTLNCEKLAEDALQVTFLKIWDKIELYDESKSQLFTWMSRIARNTALDLKKLKNYELRAKTCSLDLNLHNNHKDVMSLACIDVHFLTNKLGEKNKLVLQYIYLYGYSQSETAKKLGIPLGTVKSRARNAILELRTILRNEKALFNGSFTSIILLITVLCQ
ncbi:MAG: sigma-70 family RNA polymerase sigma factor [Saprospiraceae bacterium]